MTRVKPIAKTFGHGRYTRCACRFTFRIWAGQIPGWLKSADPHGSLVVKNAFISEHFNGPDLDPRLKWHCPPAHWSIRASRLVVQPDARTDFWQRTHYGFSTDNGHLLYGEVAGDFALTTRVRFAPVHQYDQAGLMVRGSPDCWLKTSVEFESEGPSRLGAVITRGGYSDWSTQEFPADRDTIELRVELRGQDVRVGYRLPATSGAPAERARWTQIRLGHLPISGVSPVQAGVYACSPKVAGFTAEFDFLAIERL